MTEKITIPDGTSERNIIKTIIDMKINAVINANMDCWKKTSPRAGPTLLILGSLLNSTFSRSIDMASSSSASKGIST